MPGNPQPTFTPRPTSPAPPRHGGKVFDFKVEVPEHADIENRGTGSALAVGRGSHQPCESIVMPYPTGPAAACLVVPIGQGMAARTATVSPPCYVTATWWWFRQ